MTDEAVSRRVQTLLDEAVSLGEEVGLQVAAYYKDDLIVDAWAGVADEQAGRPVDGETLFTVFSATKGITSTAIHMLAERGQLDYDAPVAAYWPEYAANGKKAITVRQVLTHSAGVPHMPASATPESISDWNALCASLASLSPIWPPGTKSGYHAYSFGWILGEVLRRVDGRSIAQFVQEDLCRPLELDGLFLGITDSVEPRVATLKNPPRVAVSGAPPEPSELMRSVIPGSLGLTAEVFNRADVRRASFPAAGGIMNARSLARLYACLASGGELQGVRVLSEAQLAVATELQFDGVDEVLQRRTHKALGFWLGGSESQIGPWPTAFGHAGAGGALGFADREGRFAYALTKNLIRAGPPVNSIAHKVARAIMEEIRLATARP